MEGFVLFVLAALGAGAIAGVQIPINALASSKLGLLEGAFLIHLVGAVASGLTVLLAGLKGLGNWQNLPWYGYLGGLFGVLLVTGLSFATPRLGVTATLVLFVVAQLVTGAIIGSFGWFGTPVQPINLTKIAGAVFLLVGAWLVVRPS